VLTLATIRAVVVTVIDVREGRGFELGVLHASTVAPIAWGLLLYNSYSGPAALILYGHRSANYPAIPDHIRGRAGKLPPF
jgi:hypothetical protein